jgi:tetratricopeptide (TPR) repeat protein
MLKVFVSSTFRDLKREREELIENLDHVLETAAMEKFIPHGGTSQEDAITQLRDSDVVIFLISPFYGSLLDMCVVKDCKAACGMKKTPKNRISYTHCEYLYAVAEGKLRQTYRVSFPDGMGPQSKTIEKKFKKLEKEVKKEFSPEIVRTKKDMQMVAEHLAHNIVQWYLEEQVGLQDFCGRRKELQELLEKMEKESVEVYGVGGIGKTTLVHVALLLQMLKGQHVVWITREPYYVTASGEKHRHTTGSGYVHFTQKVKGYIAGEKITLDDIMDALHVPEEVRIKGEDEKIRYILEKVKDTILFIDDFHTADKGVAELVKSSENVVVCSRRKLGLAPDVHVTGMEEIDDLITLKSKGLPQKAREKIKEVAEGHPVSTIILVRNYEKIDFDTLKNFRDGLNLSKEEHVEEFLRRVIEEVLSDDALEMLRVLAVLNPRLKTNIAVDSLERVYESGKFRDIFGELVDTCMVEKKEEGVYQFCFHHIRDSLVGGKGEHEIALRYYDEKGFQGNEDDVERLYHKMKIECTLEMVDEFCLLRKRVPVVEKKTFLRLIEVGEELKKYFEKGDRAVISGTLGVLYGAVRKYDEAERAYTEALTIYKELAEKNPDAYLPDVAMTQNNLGTLYGAVRKYDEAERAYTEALTIRKELAEKNPDAYLLDLFGTQINTGILYITTNKTKKGITILETMVEKNLPPDYRAVCFANLGYGYETLNTPKAPPYYFFASANYFTLYTLGVHCLEDVLYYLDKVIELSKESKGDALLMKTAIKSLSTPQDITIPDVTYSPRGKAIIEAFKGKKYNFEPENDIDVMALTLAEHIRASYPR